MPKPKDTRERPLHLPASRAVAYPDEMLTPWERAKKARLLRRETDPAVQHRVLTREEERARQSSLSNESLALG